MASDIIQSVDRALEFLIYLYKKHDQSGLTWVLFAVAIMVRQLSCNYI